MSKCFPLHTPIADIPERWRRFRVVPEATSARLFDHLVDAGEQRRRHGQAKRLRGLEIDDQIEFGRLLDWNILRPCATQYPVNVRCGAPQWVYQ
jgi:hypothetical protein